MATEAVQCTAQLALMHTDVPLRCALRAGHQGAHQDDATPPCVWDYTSGRCGGELPVRDVGTELRAAAEFLAPELALEIHRLQELEHRHELALERIRAIDRQLHEATVMVGELRQRTVRAETRLEDLGADVIVKARAAAYLLGDGFVRITSHGRGRFTTNHVPTEQVILRAD